MRADDALEICEVKTAAGVEAFVRLPERLYVDDPIYIPPLRRMVHDKLDKRKNTFLDRTIEVAVEARDVARSLSLSSAA